MLMPFQTAGDRTVQQSCNHDYVRPPCHWKCVPGPLIKRASSIPHG
jgi:hypothetical protein